MNCRKYLSSQKAVALGVAPPAGMGFLPLIAAAVTAAGTAYAAKSQAGAAKSAAKAEQKMQLQIAQMNLRAVKQQEKASKRRWLYIGGGAVALLATYLVLRRKRR